MAQTLVKPSAEHIHQFHIDTYDSQVRHYCRYSEVPRHNTVPTECIACSCNYLMRAGVMNDGR